jgi:hypothetical protein
MALKRRFQDEDVVQELILESVCDAHTSEAEDISPPQRYGDTEEEDRTKTGNTHRLKLRSLILLYQ